MKPQIDHIYAYRPNTRKSMLGLFKKIDHRHIEGQDYRFKRGNVLEKSDGIHRYAKTYTINGQERTLLMITLNDDSKAVAKFFNESVRTIKADSKVMDKVMLADTKPVDLGLTYVY